MGLREFWNRLTGKESTDDLRAMREHHGSPDALPMAGTMPPFDESQEPISAGRVHVGDEPPRQDETERAAR
jgi:hypothetical protein